MAMNKEMAENILRDGKIRGKPITVAQRRHFREIAEGVTGANFKKREPRGKAPFIA